jgi:hypothetical protein
MKSFSRFLIEKNMPLPDALKVFGLSSVPSADDFNKKYKELIRANHPDRGGDTAKMGTINSAADTIKDALGKGATFTFSSKVDWEKINDEIDALATVIEEKIEEKINVAGLELHFEKLFKQEFSSEARFSKRSKGTSFVTYHVKVFNDSNNIVANLRISANVNDLRGKKMLANPEAELNLTLSTDITIERRQIKLFQRSFVWGQNEKTLNDFDTLFPEGKFLQKVAKAKARVMKKADYLGTFRNELGAQISDNRDAIWIYLPVGDYWVVLYRTVFMKLGVYNFNGVNVHKNSPSGSRDAEKSKGYASVFEKPNAVNELIDGLQAIQRKPGSAAEVRDAVDKLFEKMKEKSRAELD